MTTEQARMLVRRETQDHLAIPNDHEITLGSALVEPERITIIVRTVRNGVISDEKETVWLVGRGPDPDGYMILMRDDGMQFGLASRGFPKDKYPILCGLYGDLMTRFMGM